MCASVHHTLITESNRWTSSEKGGDFKRKGFYSPKKKRQNSCPDESVYNNESIITGHFFHCGITLQFDNWMQRLSVEYAVFQRTKHGLVQSFKGSRRWCIIKDCKSFQKSYKVCTKKNIYRDSYTHDASRAFLFLILFLEFLKGT